MGYLEKDVKAEIEKVKEALKEILDDDDNDDMFYSLVSQKVYDDLRILLVRLLVAEHQKL